MTLSKEFELLKKFVALANNNPNEHEANVAARRVCLMLAKHDFAFVQQQQAQTWNDVKRNDGPPQWKSTYPGGTGFDPFEYLRREYERNQEKWYYNREPHEAKIPNNWFNGFKKPSKQQKEERLLKCKTCKAQKLTKFVGLAELFECNTCQWTAYGHQTKAKR